MGALPDEAADVFRADPDGFVAARNDLATRLAEAGRAEDAAAVKALRKPTVAVWALNQLHDRNPSGVRALLDAGTELRAAQQAAISSSKGGAERLRSAGQARRAAVATLAASATDALGDVGRNAASQTDAIVAALETASVDAETGHELTAGTIQRIPDEPAGFGDVFAITAVPDGEDEDVGTTGGGKGRKTRSRAPAADDRRALEAEVTRLRRDRDAAQRVAAKARAAADGFAHELEGMRERLEKIEAKHAEASTRAGASALELKRAERDLAKATARLERSRGS